MLQPLHDNQSACKADIDACRALLAGGSRTFYAASFLLPKRVRDPATALYAFCRLADDAVDLDDDSGNVVDDLLNRLARAYAGSPEPCAADRAFAQTVRAFDIPKDLPEALIEGFAWDKHSRRYETINDLKAYAVRVAGTVGTMMALLMGVRDRERLARACDLGVAMQLTNIARDVGEDARAGRLYLPLAWLREAGIDPDAWLAKPEFTPALASVIERVLAVAEELYERSETGIAHLPAECRPGIFAARYLYAGIGHEVARNGHNSVSQRARMPAHRKLATLTRISRGTAASLVIRPDPAPLVPPGAVPSIEAAWFSRVLPFGEARDRKKRTGLRLCPPSSDSF
jgi:phytoene synthase